MVEVRRCKSAYTTSRREHTTAQCVSATPMVQLPHRVLGRAGNLGLLLCLWCSTAIALSDPPRRSCIVHDPVLLIPAAGGTGRPAVYPEDGPPLCLGGQLRRGEELQVLHPVHGVHLLGVHPGGSIAAPEDLWNFSVKGRSARRRQSGCSRYSWPLVSTMPPKRKPFCSFCLFSLSAPVSPSMLCAFEETTGVSVFTGLVPLGSVVCLQS